MAKSKQGPNPNARKCLGCGQDFPSKFALKDHRRICGGVQS